MKNNIKRIIFLLTGNKLTQKIFEKIVFVCEYFMGIGSGGGVDNSGEKTVFKILQQLNQKPSVIFDIGANKGQFLKIAIDNTRNYERIIYSFEPSKRTFEILHENTHGIENVHLNNFAFGKECGSFPLYYDSYGSGLASLTKRDLDFLSIEMKLVEEISVSTVDTFCADQKINRINLLKIDVEGHELDVLNGSLEKFKNKQIDMVLFEFGGCNIDTRTYFRDFFNFFKTYDFTIFRITPSGYLHKIDHYSETLEKFSTTNFLALSRGMVN